MEKKERLITLLEECIQLENEAVPLYTQYLEIPEFFEGARPEDADRLRKALRSLADDAVSHRGIFESLLAKVKQDGPHVQ